jgi:mRNA-degrading endonuclease RelE of RelBE toxin-antitoxin system
MTYQVLLHPDADAFLDDLDEKSERICRENLGYLAENPYPGRGRGDKEGLVIDGDERYRMHISRSYTAFYDIYDDQGEVRVTEILPIDEAHKRYGY